MKYYSVEFRSGAISLCWRVVVRASSKAWAIINASKAFEESMFDLEFDRIEIKEITLSGTQ